MSHNSDWLHVRSRTAEYPGHGQVSLIAQSVDLACTQGLDLKVRASMWIALYEAPL